MTMVLRGVVGIVGLLGILIAARIWMAPTEFAAQLGVEPAGPLGLATIRADMAGFFGGAGAFALFAAFKGRGGLLVAPLLLIGIALAGRLLTVALDGFTQEMASPMAIEAVLLVVFAAGWKFLPR
jgi:hypothetical protein